MKIVFLGTPDFVQPIKQELAKHFTVVNSLNEADLCIVAAYGKILTKDELDIPKYGCINVHPSLLPKYRGPSPIQQTILNGDKVTGITIIKMDEEVDHGPIIYQEEMELSNRDNFQTLRNKMFQRAADILPNIIKDFVNGGTIPHGQNDTKAVFCQKLTKDSGYFDINNPPSPEVLDRMIRAYHPWPGVWTYWEVQSAKGKVKRVVKFLPEGKIQMEGKKPISFKDFLNGYPDFPIRNI